MPDAHGFLAYALIYLLAAVVFVPIASRLGLGSVIGYLIAGVVIGPFGLGLIREVETIYAFAEFGVVLMLFVIGLELDPARLWGLRRQVFVGGSLQMGVCGVVLSLGALTTGLSPAAACVAGFALALSSTAVAVQTMSERGVLASPVGRAAFGVLLFQDLAAIPLIAIVPLLATSATPSSDSPWLSGLKVVAAAGLVVGVGRLAVRPVLRAIARTHLRDVFTAVSLLVVIATALLMDLAGVSMALGAFLAGVLLASSEYRHALETDIEPFRGLLMGLFFVAVGMSIDFALLAHHPVFIAALLLGFVVLKSALLFLLSWPIGAPHGRRPEFAAILSQGSEFAFVVFGIAGAARVLPGDWNKLLTLVVALSLVLTPLLVGIAVWLQCRRGASTREPDRIEAEGDEVIIVGFGRFGQIVGRLLFASGIRATVLDHDPDNIELLRRLGFRVFYGDGTRLDLLTAAGAEGATVLVNAIDDMDASLKLVDLVRQYFPHLLLVARVRDVTHWRELRERGVRTIERETFESALRIGRHTLEALGVRPLDARERADAFRRHNLLTMESLLEGWSDETRRISLARTARIEFERQFQQDQQQLEKRVEEGWRRSEGE
jgi:glutathione-regulated potassium-efflux system ancillary protein KefC